MNKFETGVLFYTKAYAVIEVNFPENKVCCDFCPFYSQSSRHCQIDKNIVPANPRTNVGLNCPLILKEEKDEI